MSEKVTKLYKMGGHWYATWVTGNLSMTGPTSFPSHTSREKVIEEIRKRNPDIIIEPAAYAGE